jgi:DNA mismatch endonuclease (patch repair protein)
MTDTMTREQRSAHMARIRGRRTTPEMLLHGRLKGKRVRHKMWPDWLHGHPDVVIYGEGVRDTVVFVNGCFWHGCPRHFRCPKTNRKFWAEKIRRNGARHRAVVRKLRGCGYRVFTLWEHDIMKKQGRFFNGKI